MVKRKNQNNEIERINSNNKSLKTSTDKSDTEVESDEDEKELESYLFGGTDDQNSNHGSEDADATNLSETATSDESESDTEEDDELEEPPTISLENACKDSPRNKNENDMDDDLKTYVFEDRKGDSTSTLENGHKTHDKSHKSSQSEDEEDDLESFLFGDFSKKILAESIKVKSEDVGDKTDETPELLSFEISTKPGIDFHIDNKNDINAAIEFRSNGKDKPAWIDPDDNVVSIDIKNKGKLRKLRENEDDKNVSGIIFQERLRSNFEKVLPAPAWADISRANTKMSDDEEDEDKIFKTRKKLLRKSETLMKGIISVKRLKDLNRSEPSNSTITSLKFHPTSKIALTSSLNKNLCVYQVDGRENPKLQSIFLEDFPIHSTSFSPQGDKIYCTSRRKSYYVYDMIGGSVMKIPGLKGRKEKSLEQFTLSPNGDIIAFLGQSGYINLVSTNTNQWIGCLKMNGGVNTAMFSPDSSKLYSAGRDGEVYIWDLKSRRCLHRFIDEGSLRTTTIGIPETGRYIALGSNSGVVNVYDDKCFVEKSPTPLKAIMNLTTSINGTVFNPTSEIMACYSSQKRNALKLVHFPSLTTFSNWPIEKQTLGNVSCVDFSPKSGYMGIGNEMGKALLFRLDHYPDS